MYRASKTFTPTAADPPPKGFSDHIRQQAGELGFELVGIVPAAALSTEQERLREWLARGYHGEMSWMARDPEKRTDPRKVFPAARSIIVVALNYYTPEQHSPSPGSGKVSRYAWGDDYHDVVGDKLRDLLSWIQTQVPTASGKVCVDIQPLMDKAWGVRAGLGWIGKHTNLISKQLGSWIFIGELITNLDLEYDEEVVEDHCGTCTHAELRSELHRSETVHRPPLGLRSLHREIRRRRRSGESRGPDEYGDRAWPSRDVEHSRRARRTSQEDCGGRRTCTYWGQATWR